MIPMLATLPLELSQEIISLLLLPDQASLGRTCKVLNQLLTPTIWSEIELHHRGTHEGINVAAEADAADWDDPKERLERALADEKDYPYNKSILDPSPRKYAQGEFDHGAWAEKFKLKEDQHRRHVSHAATRNVSRDDSQFGKEDQLIRVRKITSKERWDLLAHHVQSLCMSTGVDDEVVEMIASFRNLRNLELVGYSLEKGHVASSPDVYMPRLQSLKLRGYFPAALVRKFCGNAEHITHLNLGLLATSTDDGAYADTLLKHGDSWALVSDEEAERYQQNGAEAAALASNTVDTTNSLDGEQSDNIDGADENTEEGGEEDEEEEEPPWALHSPIWLPRSLPLRFAALTHLHLVKPYTGTTTRGDAFEDFVHIPHRYEQILNKEWVFLIEAVAGTLKELILEHRVPMQVGDTVGDGDPYPEDKRSAAGYSYMWDSGVSDRGDELFCTSVLRLLLEQSARFSQLRQLSFRGIQVNGLPTRTDTDGVPGKNGVPDNDKLLHQAFPNCSVEIFEQMYPIHVYADDTYEPPEHPESTQDEGDGLLWDASFYNDYRKRFGPQWRVQRQ
ncbi:hypothetical protein SCAR479_00486 [Seiridium cardinale]|uniref:F-box domain-containing protein n=1 Tax=Seiridium cardinale TaxID=138064 RepID=A0ABR2Y9N2_9PEZI